MNKIYSTVVAVFLTFSCVLALAAQAPDLRQKSDDAEAAMTSGDYQKAISLYQELTAQLPDIPGLWMNLGMAHFMAGELEAATGHLQKAVKTDPTLLTAWLFLGTARLELGQAKLAAAALGEYVEKNPKEPRGRQLLGDAFLAAQQYQKAVEQYGVLSELDPKNPKAWYGLGTSYEALSGEAFAKLESIAPDSGYWFALVGHSRVAQQQHASAFYFYRQALERKPDLRGIHIAISRIYRESDHPDWAEKEEAREIALGMPDCTKEKAVCAYLSGDLKGVLATASGEPTPEKLYWRSQVYNQLTLAAFAQLFQLPPTFEVHSLKAEIHRNQRRPWEAVKEWKKALELAPDDYTTRRELAISLYLNREYDEARTLVEQLLLESPESPRMNFLAGDIRLYQQQPAEAIPFLEKAVQYDPQHLASHSSLGRALMGTGKPGKAIPHLKEALPLDENGDLLYQLARAYARTGDQAEAEVWLQRYQEIRKAETAEQDALKEEIQITAP